MIQESGTLAQLAKFFGIKEFVKPLYQIVAGRLLACFLIAFLAFVGDAQNQLEVTLPLELAS